MRPSLPICLALLAASCRPEPQPPKVTEEELALRRQACEFGAGALAEDTLATDAPKGDAMPVDHIVLVMQENRSFDHYFSELKIDGLRVAPPDAWNPDKAGKHVQRYHETRYCLYDPNHSYPGSAAQYHNGKNDGFVVTSEPQGSRAMAYYDESDLPFYYALARTFALSDAHFSSVMGPTLPNRLYYLAGTSFGITEYALPPINDPDGKPYPNLFTRLNQARVSWKVYTKDTATAALFLKVLAENGDRIRPYSEFASDLAAGTLPSVVMVEARYDGRIWGDEDDEHPESNMQVGQRFTAEVVNAVMHSSLWPRTVMFFSYDEHGGFYDSVPPGPACVPDALTPIGYPSTKFDHYGFRVPLIVISPYAKRGFVSHAVSDHTSILRFIEARYGLKAMSARDANAWPLLDMFDFDNPDTSIPTLPEATVDAARMDKCRQDFPHP